jgi:hypothetical protein
MAEAVAIAVHGGALPPIPAGSQIGGPRDGGVSQLAGPAIPPQASKYVEGFAPPAASAPAAGGYTQAQVDALIAAAVANPTGAAAPAPVVTPATAPAAQINAGTADETLNAYQSGFSALGPNVDMERAMGVALARGDATLIDAAYLKEVGGAAAAQLTTLATAMVKHVQAAATRATTTAYAAAGGEAQWGAAVAAFNQTAEPYLKAMVTEMLNSGDYNRIDSASKMVVAHAKNSGQVAHPGQLIQGGAGGPTAGQGLTKADYQAQHFALSQKINSMPSAQFAQARADLQARRTLGASLGM